MKLIQVCWNIEDQNTLKIEIDSLKHTGEKLNVKEGIIITFDNEKEDIVDGDFVVKFVPAFRFLLT
jgi:predicted AAA+ superfamily ATPase